MSPTLTPMSGRWSLRYVATSLAAVLLLTAVTGCSDDSDDPDPDRKVRLTPITKFDATSVQLLRQEFCDRIPEDAIAAAVGDVDTVDAYSNGEAHQITNKVNDVAHEYSCTWVGDRGDVARAWVFGPRITIEQANELTEGAKQQRGCEEIDSHDFGTPSAGVLCTIRGGREASYRGLFVDTWLACSLTDRHKQLTDEKLLKRAGQWCVQAARAASS